MGDVMTEEELTTKTNEIVSDINKMREPLPSDKFKYGDHENGSYGDPDDPMTAHMYKNPNEKVSDAPKKQVKYDE